MSRFTVCLVSVLSIFIFFNCKRDENKDNEETILKGKATIFVDETITPIVEDQVMVFESDYDAKFTLVSKSEAEVLNALFNKKAKIVVIARNLSQKELNIFEQRKLRDIFLGNKSLQRMADTITNGKAHHGFPRVVEIADHKIGIQLDHY